MGVDRMESQPHVGSSAQKPEAARDAGFSLVEIVVSMFLIGIIAVSVLPVLIQTLRASALNITVATSAQMLNEEFDAARAAVNNCAQLQSFINETPPSFTDSQKVVLQARRTSSGGCTDTTLGAAVLTITVTRGDSGAKVARATTMLSVLAAGPTPTPTPSASAQSGP